MAQNWYAIQTYSGSELSVKRALLQLAEEMADGKISEVLVPTEDLIEIKKGKKSIVERPLYPAYAFAKIDLDTALWHRIQSMPRVGRFIGESKKPTPLSKKDIDAILDYIKNPGTKKAAKANDAEVAVVDPIYPELITDWLSEHKRHLSVILLSHGHHDHVAGVDALVSKYGAQVWGHEDSFKKVDRVLRDGERIKPRANSKSSKLCCSWCRTKNYGNWPCCCNTKGFKTSRITTK